MNKYQEALKYLTTFGGIGKRSGGKTMFIESIKTIQELVEKATPKKRIYVDTTPSISSHFICQVCRTKVSPIRLYCDNCGQRLE